MQNKSFMVIVKKNAAVAAATSVGVAVVAVVVVVVVAVVDVVVVVIVLKIVCFLSTAFYISKISLLFKFLMAPQVKSVWPRDGTLSSNQLDRILYLSHSLISCSNLI